MAIKGAWTNLFFKWSGTELSDHVKSFTFAEEDSPVDITAMGDTARIMKSSGIPSWAGTVVFHQDFGSSSVQELFQGRAGNSTATLIAFRASTASAGSANKHYSGTAVITGYTGFQGGVGENAEAELTFVGASAITASTST